MTQLRLTGSLHLPTESKQSYFFFHQKNEEKSKQDCLDWPRFHARYVAALPTQHNKQ